MEKKETVILFRGQIESLLSLSSLKDVKTILRAIVLYGMDNETPEIPEHLTFGWLWFKNTIDAHREQYKSRCEKNRNSAKKRWDANACNGMPMDANACNGMPMDANACNGMPMDANDADKDKDKDNDFSERDNAHAHGVSEIMVAAEEIAKIYPRDKIGIFRNAVNVIAEAIQREMEQCCRELTEAIATVKSGTMEYALAVREWKDKSFISTPENFFGSGMYNHDPATFKRETKGGRTGKKRYNPADPTTWDA